MSVPSRRARNKVVAVAVAVVGRRPARGCWLVVRVLVLVGQGEGVGEVVVVGLEGVGVDWRVIAAEALKKKAIVVKRK